MNRAGFLLGLGFGFIIAATRLNEYDTIHNMLLLRDLEPYLFMGSAVASAAPLLWLLQRRRWRTPLNGPLVVGRSRVERKHVLGSMVFGTGWAIAGTCPVPIAAMVAGGSLLGLPVMAGLFAGLALHKATAEQPTASPATPAPDAAPLPAG